MLHISILTIDLSLGKRLHVRHTIKACTPSAQPPLSLFPGISTILKMEHIIPTMILAYYTIIHVYISIVSKICINNLVFLLNITFLKFITMDTCSCRPFIFIEKQSSTTRKKQFILS